LTEIAGRQLFLAFGLLGGGVVSAWRQRYESFTKIFAHKIWRFLPKLLKWHH